MIARPIYAAQRPVALDTLGTLTSLLTALHGADLTMTQHGAYFVFFTPGEYCDCRYCSELILQVMMTCDPSRDASFAMTSNPLNRMFVCAACGNKRCPRAMDHKIDCAGSNSRYFT